MFTGVFISETETTITARLYSYHLGGPKEVTMNKAGLEYERLRTAVQFSVIPQAVQIEHGLEKDNLH